MKKVHITTLGCSKNTVDSEVLLGQLQTNHFAVVAQPQEADVLIINTCGFIQEAKEESIQAIFEALKLKEDDPAKKVYVAGCLTQRYRAEIENEIPEVDAVFGVEEYRAILKTLGVKHAAMDNIYRMRKITTPRHYAYLKISEGCDHACSFCAIPSIRGRHRSRTIDSLVDETQKLVDHGAKEVILISQDTSAYGKDLYGRGSIVQLAEQLLKIEGLEWLRLLYWYPTNFPPEILTLMRDNPKLIPYIDLPVQHASDPVLRLMRRAETQQTIRDLIAKIRHILPQATVRSTLILGHPGETEKDFEELLSFVKDIKFDRLGTFTYSDEDHTYAYNLPDKVPHEVALQRQQMVMEAQKQISLQKNRAYIGRKLTVLVDEWHEQSATIIGRTFRDAPEIDNEVLISLAGQPTDVSPGTMLETVIVDASEYELYGRPLKTGEKP